MVHLPLRTFLVLSLLLIPSTHAFSGTADEWIGKAARAVVSLSQGNSQSAAQQMLPSAEVKLANPTRLQVGAGGVSLRQSILPAKSLHNPYVSVAGTYNANVAPKLNGPPNLSNNVQFSAGNQYLTNTTTLSKNFSRHRS